MRQNPLFSAGVFLGLALFTLATSAETESEYKERLNRGTVGIVTGGVDGTYIRVASDLANVLDDDNLRVIAVIGKCSVQNIEDLLYLRGIDIGIVQSDVLTFVQRQGKHPRIERNVRYITKLYNEEFHLLANKRIQSARDLGGEKVNFGLIKSGTHMTASIVVETLGLDVEAVSFDQELALEKVKSGEIAAMVYVAGKPTRLFKNVEPGSDVHFLEVEQTPGLLETYLPSRLEHDDYPLLIPPGENVKTVAIGAVMAVYNWQPDTPRYRKTANFVATFFDRFSEFKQPPRHPKWREVNLAAIVPGWTRYGPAEQWLAEDEKLRRDADSPRFRKAFSEYLQNQDRTRSAEFTDPEKEKLFQDFIRWFDNGNR